MVGLSLCITASSLGHCTYNSHHRLSQDKKALVLLQSDPKKNTWTALHQLSCALFNNKLWDCIFRPVVLTGTLSWLQLYYLVWTNGGLVCYNCFCIRNSCTPLASKPNGVFFYSFPRRRFWAAPFLSWALLQGAFTDTEPSNTKSSIVSVRNEMEK